MFIETIYRYFSDDSPLKNDLPYFAPREGQRLLAHHIAKAIDSHTHLVAEAGTGTGKTFAYLIPALLSGKKVLISTGTKALQDQLFYKDLPLIKKNLKHKKKVTLLKGRQNYICQHRLLNHEHELLFYEKESSSLLHEIRSMHARTRFGEISEIKFIPENSEVFRAITSTSDNCLGKTCDFYQDCYVNKARKRALEADVIVINHALFFADFHLKDESMGELLPKTDVIIFDEAHQLPEIATRFYGDNFASRELSDFIEEVELESLLHAKDMKQLPEVCHRLKQRLKEVRLGMGDTGVKQTWQQFLADKFFRASIEKLIESFHDLGDLLLIASERTKNFDQYWKNFQALLMKLTQMMRFTLEDATVHWAETFSHSFMIHQSPLSVRQPFQETLNTFQATCIFTSATLTVDHHFTHYLSQLGLDACQTLAVPSPFSYETQALLYVPRKIVDVKSKAYIESIVQAAIPVIEAAKGRTFFLFTSYFALNKAAELLKERLNFPLFLQGDAQKDVLLKDFIASENGVLLATMSFWEGVDVRGQALSCVIIDKLPFAVPDDPIHKARMACLTQQGQDPFWVYTLPQAVIVLKQGVGRLIRDIDDKGVLMLCDPRLIARPYGEMFLAALSEYPRTRELSKVEAFLAAIQ